MPTKFDVPGLPDGTVIVPQPATCPELADVYNAPSCAFPHDLTYIPMDILPETGGELWWWLAAIGVLLILGGVIAVGLPAGVAKARRRAEKP
ncbi:LPXTG cell wall anchor domain-containing protein [Microbacterium sp. BR1]|uniref:LPXTG cell wall anchor domain-containing protein n=1 Tax=Microbacterium sp. BR1 TaxID=1070896 RepID=UPI0012FE0D5A|nr:LPXTG cell wall anchor domain-containing protein [Microbacterium sp. BR1]